ncbi:MAG: toll/interleukin-1 receptor domain-containing protein [Paludibacteraceae bacterium]|nr:toll/interleukin-1 receptor domain-containing protein [Paludibacteraceae bacterium]
MTKYSVFISYRRTGFDTANLIAEKLRFMGYSVFFDVESLRGGKFNEQLFQVIDSCTDMVLVLPKDALNRCADKDDWVRKEVMYAMLKQKNIVPVMLNDFDWPNPMPSGMEDLKDYQAVPASDRNTFDLAMQRLASYLKAPHRRRIMLTRVMGIVAVVLALLGILFGVLRLSSLPACKKAANEMCYNVGLVYQIYEKSEQMQTEWQQYQQSITIAQTTQRKQGLKEDMAEQIRHWQTDIAQLRAEIRPETDYTALEAMLLASRGLLTIELACEQPYIESLCDDIDTACVHMRRTISGEYYNSYSERMIQLDFAMLLHSLNAYYYAYLSELSHLPSSTREMHQVLSSTWRLFPTESDNQPAHYYDDKMQREFDKLDQMIKEYEVFLVQQESDLGEMEQQLDNIQVQLDSMVVK